MNDQLPAAIVIGLDSMQGIQTARILAGRGIDVIAIADDPHHHCCKTNCCSQILFANTQSDDFLNVLASLAAERRDRPVLYPCHDETVRVIARHRESLVEDFRFSLPDTETIELLSNKQSFYLFAKEKTLPIPATYLIRSRNDAKETAERMVFPAVLKPSARTLEWNRHTLSKAYKVENAAEFLAQYSRCSDWVDTLILQEWIEGGDDSLYSCNCYFDRSGDPLCSFVARKIRQWPPHVGISSLGEECRDDVVLNETLRLFRSVDYRGLGYTEFKKDPVSGRHYLIEPNIGRPTGRSAIAEAGGVEMLYTMYCDCVGLPLPANRVQKFTGAKWIDLRHDCQSAFHYWKRGQLSLRQWYRSWKGPKAHTYFSWRDPAPFIYDLLRLPRRLWSRKERNKRDYVAAGRAEKS